MSTPWYHVTLLSEFVSYSHQAELRRREVVDRSYDTPHLGTTLFQLGRSFTSGKLRSGMNRPAPDCWLPRSHRAHRARGIRYVPGHGTLGRSAARQQEEPDTQPRWKNSRHGRLHADERPRDAAVDVPCMSDLSIRSPEESAENSRRIPKTWTLPLKGPHGANQVQSRLDSLRRRGGGHCRRFVTATDLGSQYMSDGFQAGIPTSGSSRHWRPGHSLPQGFGTVVSSRVVSLTL